MKTENPGGWRRMTARTGLGLAGLVVAALIGFGLMLRSGGDGVQDFCRDAAPGLPFPRLAALADRHGVRLTPGPSDGSGTRSLLAHAPQSFGRHTCLVRHDNNAVLESQYGFSD
jgi:hypothetical protein